MGLFVSFQFRKLLILVNKQIFMVGKAAYVASIVSFHKKYLRVLLGNVNVALVLQNTLLSQFIHLSKLFCGTDKLCPTVYELLDMKASKIKTVQGSLTDWLHQVDVDSINGYYYHDHQ